MNDKEVEFLFGPIKLYTQFMTPSAFKLYGDADFDFPDGLGTSSHC